MRDETLIDGEIVAPDQISQPSFSAPQNHAAASPIYYAFDAMIVARKDVMNKPLTARHSLLQEDVLAKLSEPIRESPELEVRLPDLITSVKTHGIESLVAKRRDRVRVNRPGSAPRASDVAAN